MNIAEKEVASKEILQPTCPIVTTGCRERRAREMLIDEHLRLRSRAERMEKDMESIHAALERKDAGKGLSEEERRVIMVGVQDRLALAEAERRMRIMESELHAARIEADTIRTEKRRLQEETDRLLQLRNMDGSEMDVEVRERQKLLQKLRSETEVLRRHKAAMEHDTAALTGSYNALAHNHNALLQDVRLLHGSYRSLLHEYGLRYPEVVKRLPQGYEALPHPRTFLGLPWAARRIDPYRPLKGALPSQAPDFETVLLRRYANGIEGSPR